MTLGNTRVGFLAIGVVSLSVRSAARRYAKSPLMRSRNPMGSLGTVQLHVIGLPNRPPAIAVRRLRSGRSGEPGKGRKAIKGRARQTGPADCRGARRGRYDPERRCRETPQTVPVWYAARRRA